MNTALAQLMSFASKRDLSWRRWTAPWNVRRSTHVSLLGCRCDRPKSRSVRVFLSYSSSDKLAARRLYKKLNDDNFQPWFNEEDILLGQDWKHEIEKAISYVDVILICLSNSAISNPGYFHKKMHFALEKAKEQPSGSIFRIPVKLDNCQVPPELGDLQYVDLQQDDYDNQYLKLRRSLDARAQSLEIV